MSDRDFRIELDRDQHIAGDHVAGDTPGYLFLHGLGSARSGEKSESLEMHAARRRAAFTRLDFRGHGDSAGTIGHVTVRELIADVVAVLERFGPAAIVGSSLGGLVGAFATAERPDLVAGLALVAPALGFLHRLERTVDEDGRMWTQDGRSFPLAPRVIEDAQQLDERDLPRRITVPTLIVHGDADSVVPHRRSRRFFAAIPHPRKELWIVPDGDHRLGSVTDEMWRRLDALLASDRP